MQTHKHREREKQNIAKNKKERKTGYIHTLNHIQAQKNSEAQI